MTAAAAPSARDPLADDPGLQLQRTALAWQRTVLASAALGVIGAMVWVRLEAPVVALLCGGLGLVPLATRRRHVVRSAGPPWSVMAALVGTVCGLAVAGAAAAAVGALA